MPSKSTKGEPFFFYYSLVILIIVVGAFGVNALIKFEELPPVTSTVIFHGTIMIAWYALVVVQPGLIIQNNHRRHIAFGKASILLAVGVVVSAGLITIESYLRTGRSDVVAGNLFMIINFIILYSLAIYRRRHSEYHKRLVLFASIAIILPSLGRIAQATNINEFITLPILLLLMVVPLIYDSRTLREVHRATVLGIALVIAGIALAISLIESPAWSKFLEATIGNG
jgi:hypothetical protein